MRYERAMLTSEDITLLNKMSEDLRNNINYILNYSFSSVQEVLEWVIKEYDDPTYDDFEEAVEDLFYYEDSIYYDAYGNAWTKELLLEAYEYYEK